MMMQTYQNISGAGGILAYAEGEEYIEIKFVDGSVYRYDYANPGKRKVERMKYLAAKGKGLTTFINQHVRGQFSLKK